MNQDANNSSSDQITSCDNMGEIARIAYDLWQQQGCPEGSAIDHWLEAEAHYLQCRNTEESLREGKDQGTPPADAIL